MFEQALKSINIPTTTSLCMILNITSSISLVLMNKFIFQHFSFKFGSLLTCIYFLITFMLLEITSRVGLFIKKSVKLKSVVPLSLVFSFFVVSTNLSLRTNSVGFYQVIVMCNALKFFVI